MTINHLSLDKYRDYDLIFEIAIFDSSRVKPENPLSDQKYFDQVAEELRSSGPHEGIWLRAVTECGGDEEKARVVYVKLRVEQLKSQEKDEDSIARSSYFRQNPQQLFDIRQRTERRKRSSLLIIAVAFLLFASLLVVAVIADW